LDFGGTNPYRFTDGGVHGGAGVKMYMTSRVAFRFEARGIYTPQTSGTFSQHATHFVGSAGVAFFQSDSRQRPGDADGDRVADKDGVWDGIDRCPDTPAGATVDANGCPYDSDGDKVFDGIDRCPDTVPGTPVDATGCPADSDKDGVPDSLDKCPNTPSGIQVD